MSSTEKWERRRHQRRAQAREILRVKGDYESSSPAEKLTRAFGSLLAQGITPGLSGDPIGGRGVAGDLPTHWTWSPGGHLVRQIIFTATRASVAESAWCTFRAYNLNAERTGTLTVEVKL